MDTIEKYIGVLKLGNKSENTIRAYKKDLGKFESYFELVTVDQIKDITVEQYLEFYEAQGMSDNSLKSLIRNLSAFFSWLDLPQENFSKVKFGSSKFPKVSKKKKIILTPEEADQLVSAGRNLQEKFMFKLMLVTALRRDEICNIKMSDIRGCTISIKSKGGDEDDETYLDENLCNMLQEYLKERNTDSEYLFYGTRGFDGDKLTGTSINNRVRACAILAGFSEEKLEVTTAHKLRAYAITKVYLEKGKEAAQALARHKNGDTTDLYIVVGNELVRRLLLGDNK